MLSNVALGSVHDALVMPDTEEMKSTMAAYLRPDGPYSLPGMQVGKLGVSEGRVPAGVG